MSGFFFIYFLRFFPKGTYHMLQKTIWHCSVLTVQSNDCSLLQAGTETPSMCVYHPDTYFRIQCWSGHLATASFAKIALQQALCLPKIFWWLFDARCFNISFSLSLSFSLPHSLSHNFLILLPSSHLRLEAGWEIKRQCKSTHSCQTCIRDTLLAAACVGRDSWPFVPTQASSPVSQTSHTHTQTHKYSACPCDLLHKQLTTQTDCLLHSHPSGPAMDTKRQALSMWLVFPITVVVLESFHMVDGVIVCFRSAKLCRY